MQATAGPGSLLSCLHRRKSWEGCLAGPRGGDPGEGQVVLGGHWRDQEIRRDVAHWAVSNCDGLRNTTRSHLNLYVIISRKRHLPPTQLERMPFYLLNISNCKHNFTLTESNRLE